MCNLTSVGKKVDKSFAHPQKLLQGYLVPTSLTAKEQKGSKAAEAFTGAGFELKPQWRKVLRCPEIFISRGKEDGRAGGSGSWEETRRRSCGRRVGMGSGVSLLPGKQGTNSTKPS